ncbi:MAG: hypothetical protein ACRDSZ_23890 [Pseudonocardiaceae bacterium]
MTATLRVKEVWGGGNPPGDRLRAQRFIICHNPEQAQRDAAVRGRLIAHGAS